MPFQGTQSGRFQPPTPLNSKARAQPQQYTQQSNRSRTATAVRYRSNGRTSSCCLVTATVLSCACAWCAHQDIQSRPNFHIQSKNQAHIKQTMVSCRRHAALFWIRVPCRRIRVLLYVAHASSRDYDVWARARDSSSRLSSGIVS